jgi:hypothetical protein
MRRGLRSAFDLVHMHHLQSIVLPGVVLRSLRGPACCTQYQPANAAHAIDSNSHHATSHEKAAQWAAFLSNPVKN